MHCTAVAVQQHIRVAAAHAANFKNFYPSRERFLKFRSDPPLAPPPPPPPTLTMRVRGGRKIHMDGGEKDRACKF